MRKATGNVSLIRIETSCPVSSCPVSAQMMCCEQVNLSLCGKMAGTSTCAGHFGRSYSQFYIDLCLPSLYPTWPHTGFCGAWAHHRSSCLVHKMRRCGRGQSRVQREAKCRAADSKPRTGSPVWLSPRPRAGALPKGPATPTLQTLQSSRSFSRHHFPGQLGGGRWQRGVPVNCVHAHLRARCSAAEITRHLCDKV